MRKNGTVIRNAPLYNSKKTKYEACVLCGKQTDIKLDALVDFRECYGKGVGQLCRSCWHGLYKTE